MILDLQIKRGRGGPWDREGEFGFEKKPGRAPGGALQHRGKRGSGKKRNGRKGTGGEDLERLRGKIRMERFAIHPKEVSSGKVRPGGEDASEKKNIKR